MKQLNLKISEAYQCSMKKVEGYKYEIHFDKKGVSIFHEKGKVYILKKLKNKLFFRVSIFHEKGKDDGITV